MTDLTKRLPGRKQLLEVSLLYSPGDLVAVEIAEIPKSHRYRPTRYFFFLFDGKRINLTLF